MRLADELGLDTLVEAHDADELGARGGAAGAGDRHQRARPRDVRDRPQPRSSTWSPTAAAFPHAPVVVAESGIHTRAQGAAAELAGADAILVGSALMQAPDPAAKLADLLRRPLVKVCGLTREEDVAVAAEAGADLAGFVLAPESPRAAAAVLPVPDELLAVAVWVGEAGESDATLDQVHERAERTRSAAATPSSCATASRSRRCTTSPGTATTPTTGSAQPPRAGRVVLAGKLAADNVAEAIRQVRPWAVDASSRLEVEPGIKDHEQVRAYVEAARA